MKNKMVTGPLGFKLAEGQARELERLIKNSPKDYTYRTRQVMPGSLELMGGERADISLITTDALDHDKEVVIPQGVDLNIYRQNPVVLLAHSTEELPVGRCSWIKHVQRGLLAKTVYATRPDNWEGPWVPDAVFALTQQNILKGKSIGFFPTKIRSPSSAELKQHPEWKDCQAVIEAGVMFEYSVCGVPANQEALVQAVGKGSITPDMVKALGLEVPTPKAAPKKKAVDYNSLVLKALEQIDPQEIAEKALEILRNRGRV